MTKFWRQKCYLSELRGTRNVSSFDSMLISTWNLQSLVHMCKVWANADCQERFVGLLLKQKAKTKSDALYQMYLCLHFSWVSPNNWPDITHQIYIFIIFHDAENVGMWRVLHRGKTNIHLIFCKIILSQRSGPLWLNSLGLYNHIYYGQETFSQRKI